MVHLAVKNKNTFFLVGIIIVMVLLLVAIFIINNKTNTSSSYKLINIKGYDSFRKNLNALNLGTNPYYTKTVLQFNIIEDNNALPKDKYNALLNACSFLKRIYADNQNPKVYNFIKNDLNAFAKLNYTQFYNKIDCAVACQDQSCADSNSPKEILNIIDEINSLTTISKANKDGTIYNLKNNMYYPSVNPLLKATLYLSTAQLIRTDEEYIKAGINNKIADKIDAYVKAAYPNEYNKLK